MLNSDKEGVVANTGVYASVFILFLNWVKEWHLPWQVIAFTLFVMVVGASVAGGRELPKE